MRRFVVLLAALCLTIGLASASTTQAAPPLTSASTGSPVWWVYFGNEYASNPPTVWTNRNPTWDTGGNPHLRLEQHGDLADYASFCPNGGLCWHNNMYITSLPAKVTWAGNGDVYEQQTGGAVMWHTQTGGTGPQASVMSLWPNGCMTIHIDPDHIGWTRIWQNSANPACNISLTGHS